MDFKNKVVLITGSGSGIGKAAAIAYARKGAKVVVSDINVAGGEEAVATIKAEGGDAIFIKANVANYEKVKNLIAKTVEHYGRLDIAINNAGIGSALNRTGHFKLKDWDKVIAVNQTGLFYCMKEELAIMEQQGSGNIINIASMAGLRGLPNQISYTASKHAVIGMTRAAALEYTRYNIRINAVCPVFTSTPLFDNLLNMREDMDTILKKTIPMRRFGKPEEIVEAIMWLSSDSASFTTGLALPIDGGQSA